MTTLEGTQDTQGTAVEGPLAHSRGVRLARAIRRNSVPLILTGLTLLLFGLLWRTDREQELYKSAGNRYRYHAIPVAISYLYHGHPHDYTGRKSVAHPFHASSGNMDDLILKMIYYPPEDHNQIYFWAADDRGTADYVAIAFRLFGPKTKSLSKLYFLLLLIAIGTFIAGYWRSPGVLLLPVCMLFGMLALSQVLKLRTVIPTGQTVWKEEIALYETRMFDLLALLSCLHLAVLMLAPRPSRTAWVAAVPQAALVLFLYHCRSSLGWEYLALFSLAGVVALRWAWSRWRANESPVARPVARPVFVACLLAVSLFGLARYHRATFHPDYFAEKGSRTFWHNAIMGYSYHPGLRKTIPIADVSDYDVVAMIVRHMRETNDPRLNATWEPTYILNSLGGHCHFDWKTYEQVAREVYLGVWREHTGEALECYGYYKPADVLRLGRTLTLLLTRNETVSHSPNLVGGLVGCVFALVLVGALGVRNSPVRSDLRAASLAGLALLPFSLIPGVSFYAAITTLSCFYAGAVMMTGLAMVWVGWWGYDLAMRGLAKARPMPGVSVPRATQPAV